MTTLNIQVRRADQTAQLVRICIHLSRPDGKKTCHFIIAANFAKCGPIFKSLSPTDLAVSVQ